MNKNILIIDDNIEIQTLLRMYLETKGYHIDSRYNGDDALKLLNHDDYLPGLILLDLTMPIMGGATFLNLRKLYPKLIDIPVVLMTAEEQIEFTEAMCSVVDVLKKPLNIDSVVGAVKRNLH